jgi:hypothetical protein
LIGLLVLVGATSSEPPDEIRARRFTLVDKAGIVRARLSQEEDGTILLSINDPSARKRALLGVGPDGQVSLGLGGSPLAASLVVGPDGRPGLYLADSISKIALGMVPDGKAVLVMEAKAKGPNVSVMANDNGAMVRLANSKSEGVLFLGENLPLFYMKHTNGKTIWTAP